MKRGVLILWLFSATIINLLAQNDKLEHIQHLSISEGLAHNGVTSILEDSRGYLWIGTYDGLNRYDGYEVEVYKNTIEKKIFVSNRIRTIEEDEKKNLWIGTDEGISIYFSEKGTFKSIYSNQLTDERLNGPIIRSILRIPERKIVICATEGYGILVFDEDYNFVEQHLPESEIPNQSALFLDGLVLDEDNYLFLDLANGLFHFNLKSKTFRSILKKETSGSRSMAAINEDNFLVAGVNGIALITSELKDGTYHFDLKSRHLSNYSFASVSVDTSNHLWLGTYNKGIIRIENLDDLVENKPAKISSFVTPSGFLRGSCFAITNNGCWAGTFDKGIFRFDLEEKPFRYLKESANNSEVYSNIGFVSALNEDQVFMSSKSGGLSLFNTKTQEFESLPFDISPSARANIIGVYVDSNKDIWLKYKGNGPFSRIRQGSRNIEKIILDGFDSNQIRNFTEDKNGNIWIGGLSDVYKLSLDKERNIKSIERLSENPFFTSIKISKTRTTYVDPVHDFIWVGTSVNGLLRISTKNNIPLKNTEVAQFLHNEKDETSISSNFVSSIIRLPDGQLWLGTERGGICKVANSENKPSFLRYSENQGLSNNVVKGILADKNNDLWIGTNIGLNKFITKRENFRKFGKEDGLPFVDFDYANIKMENGLMLFSGVNGFFSFDPENISNKEVPPKLELGKLKIFNQTIVPGEQHNDRILLDRSLANTPEINLKYDENVFSIEINSLHFSNPENHLIRHQLLPTSEDWIEVSSDQQYINYNGLPPGDYVLRVKASNFLNQWSEPKELKINIAPPFWKTKLAYILYFLLACFVIAAVVAAFLRFQSLNHNLEIEKLEKDNVKNLNEAKLRFFSNISHEIKTPITLISGPVDLLTKQYSDDEEVKENLQIIQRQSKKIEQLIDQVHDFQKADANLLRLHYSQFYFDEFIRGMVRDFEFMAKTDKKKLIVIGEGTKISVSADKDKLEIIFNNLLSNAFKYTSTGDTITVKFEQTNKDVIVNVSDSGRGISKGDLPFIFDRFYQSQKKSQAYVGGAGIGLAFSKRLVDMHYGFIDVESSIHEGSNFTVRLPIVKEAITADEKNVEAEILAAESNYTEVDQTNEDLNLEEITVAEEFQNAHIFYAEDNPDMRIYVSGLLSKFFKVTPFANGQECLKAMEEEWPDIIISDVLMPEVNGLELCKQVKSDIKTGHIPIILLTACTTIDDQIKGIKNGADAYLKKPFNALHLITKAESLLRTRKLLRERFQVDFPKSLAKTKVSEEDNIFLEKLYALMAKNLGNQELDLDSFAKELYLNRTHFYQKVKALTNQTPYELMKLYRLKKAAELLVQQKLSVNEIFLTTGFKSRTHFSKLFKEKYKVSPGKYGKEAKS